MRCGEERASGKAGGNTKLETRETRLGPWRIAGKGTKVRSHGNWHHGVGGFHSKKRARFHFSRNGEVKRTAGARWVAWRWCAAVRSSQSVHQGFASCSSCSSGRCGDARCERGCFVYLADPITRVTGRAGAVCVQGGRAQAVLCWVVLRAEWAWSARRMCSVAEGKGDLLPTHYLLTHATTCLVCR
jgi:hypothetical protein